jgi:hypothetical protein
VHDQRGRADLVGDPGEQRLDLDLVGGVAGVGPRAVSASCAAVRSALRAAATTCIPAPAKQRTKAAPRPGPTPTTTAISEDSIG